ncbi:GH3 auxin-responsive promoter family protein [Salibacter sp.]|uniref:GH3 auxin-responsive promoter family protein n=1 Tax=Salibacter sp. TaxID=2010995 RepID=UPI0028700E64|nr:GH3 auxin-responsive promoter family protein [Salibacter sp.]MDR9399454.1 GH3 auxin-responsive promoter family protein [Salibacter sp.]MDR9488405.1 GH3 auxin-responsive promoter family protein [Salibacter sp.]
MKKRYHQIELFMKYPHEVQAEWFNELIDSGSETEWGKKHDYASLRSLADFKKAVPVSDYDDLKPYIERIMKGEQNVLWPTEIKWFAKSSGTTSDKSKFIPISKESLEDCHYKGGKDMISIYYNHKPDSRIFSGRALVLGGSSTVNQLNKDSYYGDLSAVIIRNLPFWAEFQRTPSMDVALMDEWEEKLEKMAQITAKQDITSISGVPSWTLVLLRRVLEITGKDYISDVWPNLEMFAHGGVSFDPYRKQYRNIFNSDKITYLETYNASEGFFGIQDQFDEDNSMLLMLDYGIFYEFMPMEELGKDHPETLSLHEVETGVNYALIISTNGGLWRYQIGDTIEFTSLDPYRIRVTGRTKHFINAFGEELIVDNAEKALSIACEKTKAIVKDYTAAPVYMEGNSKGSHEWAIEFSQEPESFEFFKDTFDNALKSQNSDYEAKRYKSFVLSEPIIHKLPTGTFYNWMKKRGKLGGQNKVPRLSNNRKYIDEILEFIQ